MTVGTVLSLARLSRGGRRRIVLQRQFQGWRARQGGAGASAKTAGRGAGRLMLDAYAKPDFEMERPSLLGRRSQSSRASWCDRIAAHSRSIGGFCMTMSNVVTAILGGGQGSRLW